MNDINMMKAVNNTRTVNVWGFVQVKHKTNDTITTNVVIIGDYLETLRHGGKGIVSSTVRDFEVINNNEVYARSHTNSMSEYIMKSPAVTRFEDLHEDALKILSKKVGFPIGDFLKAKAKIVNGFLIEHNGDDIVSIEQLGNGYTVTFLTEQQVKDLMSSEYYAIYWLLRDIENGIIKLTPKQDPSEVYAGIVQYACSNGAKIAIFNDCDCWDYIEELEINDKIYDYDMLCEIGFGDYTPLTKVAWQAYQIPPCR
jgi:hypothetical protein